MLTWMNPLVLRSVSFSKFAHMCWLLLAMPRTFLWPARETSGCGKVQCWTSLSFFKIPGTDLCCLPLVHHHRCVRQGQDFLHLKHSGPYQLEAALLQPAQIKNFIAFQFRQFLVRLLYCDECYAYCISVNHVGEVHLSDRWRPLWRTV